MTEPENARGYAYTAFATTYERQLSYAAMAAAQKYGYYPSNTDYINQGLRLFDRMWAIAKHDNTTLQRIVTSIVADMGQSIRTNVIGHFKYTGAAGEPQVITTKHDVILDAPIRPDTDVTVGDTLTDIEGGYGDVERNDDMLNMLTVVAKRMSPDDMEILTAYIDGASFAEACRAKGVDADAFTKRMRYQCASLKNDLVFA